MSPRTALTLKHDKISQADSLLAISQRDMAALALSLDEYAPSDVAQENILRRVLLVINSDSGHTATGDGSSDLTKLPFA